MGDLRGQETISDSLEKTRRKILRCTAQYLCSKPNGDEFCHLVNGDFRSCTYFDERNIMYLSPEKVKCRDACKCKYAGKRPEYCVSEIGHNACGTSVNGRIPEGDVPESLVEKVRQVIPFCRI